MFFLPAETIILGCSSVGFLTNDDMQDDVSDSLWFLFKY